MRDFKTAFHLPMVNCICFFYHFWVLIKNCSNFCRKVPWRSQKKAFCISRTTIWRKWIFENFIQFLSFPDFHGKSFGWFCKSLRRVVRTDFYTSVLTFWRKDVFFWKKIKNSLNTNGCWAKIWKLFGKNFQQRCRNSFLLVYRKVLRISLMSFLNIKFGLWARLF